MPNDADYTINDLARLMGLNVRTIRYWIAQGLIPASGESGPGAHYGQGHLDRLRLIKRLQAEYLPNAEIRRRLAPLSDADVASLVGEAPDANAPRPTTSALEYVRGLLGVSLPPAETHETAEALPPPSATLETGKALPPPSARPPSKLLRPLADRVSRHFPVASIAPQITKASPAMPVGASPAAEEAPGGYVPEGIASGAGQAPAAEEAPGYVAEGIAFGATQAASLAEPGMPPAQPLGMAPAEPPAMPPAQPPAMPRPVETVLGRVAQLSDAAPQEEPADAGRPTPPERSQWERHALGPNIELHVRRPLSRLEQRRVERLIAIARQVLDEDRA